MKRFAAILIAASGFAVLALPALAQDADDGTSLDDIPHITMVGIAKTEIAPDLATITLGVVSEKPTATGAADENARKATAVVEAAKAAGIGSSDIKTLSVTLNQTFDEMHDAEGRYTGRKPRGFEASNTLSIRLRDLAKAGAIAQALIDKGANRFDGIDFSVEHPEPVQIRLMAEATKNARDQAKAVANAAGVKLGRVLTIQRVTSPGEPARPMAMSRAKSTGAPAPSMPVEAGTSESSTQIEVSWAIEN